MPFVGQPVADNFVTLLGQVIKDAIEPALNSRLTAGYHHEDEDEDEDVADSELVDQIGADEEVEDEEDEVDANGRPRRKQIPITDSITSASNNSDAAEEQAQFDAWMEKVMAKSEQEYLEEESDYEHAEADRKVAAHEQHVKEAKAGWRDEKESPSASSSDSSVDEVRRLPECKNDSTSDSEDTLHSNGSVQRHQTSDLPHDFQSPEPYQIRKSAHSSRDNGSGGAAGETLPAWLLPKSPLDAHFRKGYGGLGHADLEETIAEVTSSQKKALRESKIRDDNERASESSASRSGGDSDSESERQHNADESLPAWMIPKSPLDAHFRKGYGGLGHEDFEEAVEEITTAQKKARALVRSHQRKVQQKVGKLYSDSDGNSAEEEDGDDADLQSDDDRNPEEEFDVLEGNIITIDDLPDDFGAAPTALNPTTVGTPVHVRPNRQLTSSEGKSSRQASRSSEYAKQTKLFQSPTASKIRVSVSAKKSATKSALDPENTDPAWLIPKSPLDAHFRKGYGGLGHEDFEEAVEEITTAQKKKAEKAALSLSAKDGSNSIIKMLDAYFDSKRGDEAPKARKPAAKGKKAKKSGKVSALTGKAKKNGNPTRVAARKAATAQSASADDVGVASGNIMFDQGSDEDAEPYSFIDAEKHGLAGDDDLQGDHLLPSAHPATELPQGKLPLTKNPTLDKMMRASYLAHMAEYAKAEQAKAGAKVASPVKGKTASPVKARTASPTKASAPKPVSPSSGKKAAPPKDVADFLTSPHLKHSMEAIDEMIRANLSKLTQMRAREQALRDSFSSGVSLTDRSADEPKRGKRKPAKLTRRSTAPIRTSASTGKLPAQAKVMTRCKSTTTLHLRGTGNVRSAAALQAQEAPAQPTFSSRRSSLTSVPSRRSSLTTVSGLLSDPPASSSHASKLSAHLLSLHTKPTASSGARHSSPHYARRESVEAAASHQPSKSPNPLRSSTPTGVSRPLSSSSRLLQPTAATIIRTADIACNSSKAANIHNEWHLQLRTADHEEPEIELSGRKLANKILRQSLSALEAEHILDWSSPGTLTRR
jgi:hypothetical protein